MDLGLRGKVALVTGASAGLGRACARSLAREGVRLAVAARRMDKLETLCAEARAAGAEDARAFAADVSDAGSIAALCASVEAAFGAIDVLIVNGGGPKPGTFLQMKLEDYDAAYQLTLMSAIRMVHAVLPGMRARKWGRIVALESSSVKAPIATLSLSNTFRTAVVAAFKTLAGEVAADGVTVNVIATGRFETDRLRAGWGEGEEAMKRAAAGIPIGRVGQPDEFAPLVTFLCGEPANYITGTTIAVDGGLFSGLL